MCHSAPGSRPQPPAPRLARCVGGGVGCLAASCCLRPCLLQTPLPAAGATAQSPRQGAGARQTRQGPCKTPVRACPGPSLGHPLAAHRHSPIVHWCRLLYACSYATHICNSHALDFRRAHVCRGMDPFCDRNGEARNGAWYTAQASPLHDNRLSYSAMYGHDRTSRCSAAWYRAHL